MLWAAPAVLAQELIPLGKAGGDAILTQIQGKVDEKVTVVGQKGVLPPLAFGTLDAIRNVTISPDGTKIAFFTFVGDVSRVLVVDSTTRAVIGQANLANEQSLQGIRFVSRPASLLWLTNDRIGVNVLLDVKFGQSDYYNIGRTCKMLSMSIDGTQSVAMTPGPEAEGINFASTCTVYASGSEPGTVLMPADTPEKGGSAKGRATGSLDVWQVDVKTGRGRIAERGNAGTVLFAADSAGKIRMRVDVTREYGYQVHAKLTGSDEYQVVYTGRQQTFDAEGKNRQQSLSFLGFAAEDDKAYVVQRAGDLESIGLFNMRTGQVERTVASDPKFDVNSVVRARGVGIVGAVVDRDVTDQVYFRDDWRQLQRVIRESFPGDDVQLVSNSSDLKKHILYLEGPDAPAGEYLLLDLTTSDAKSIGFPYPLVKPGMVVRSKWVTYTSRDGVQIPAYLTMPASAPNGKGLAAIVMPHGGPQARDNPGFDWWSQYYASLGYVVLQPQYRGSDGFGRAWAKAGEQQWGLRMQDDVSDGVTYLVNQGIADAKRVCILGWSYGGYSAGAGATLTPDLYRCAVAGAGVFDLAEMLRFTEGPAGTWQRANSANSYWNSHIGNLSRDRAKIDAASPALQVKNVKAPIQVIHGDYDYIVPIKQAEIFVNALKAAGKEHEYVVLKGESHNILFARTRVEMLQKSGDFLMKHNPP
jgi:dipeptidyl aminopeptidase/acylaminoacyl peptidase